MGMIKVLDCTLRDGGYCNQWMFGYENAQMIMRNLMDANVDIIECGFLTENTRHTKDITRFNSEEEINRMLPADKQGRQFVVMMNYGEYEIGHLHKREQNGIDGIRLAFHKRDAGSALELGNRIKEKGYLLFMQPMVTLSYSDTEFLSLIFESNEIEPAAFYIVDSFGTMKKKELVRLFYLAENNLKKCTAVGFHSHNNMQLAFANAQTLADIHAEHDLIIDSSIYGMGRGAGNLNTELFLDYLNDSFGGDYRIHPLITVIDDILDKFYKKNRWGYSLPNYLSAFYNTHPSYASYLSDKNTLNVEDIDAILGMMEDSKRIYFEREYVESLYLGYLSAGKVCEQHKRDLQNILAGNKVLLVAPGKSSYEEKDIIKRFSVKQGIVVISVNHEYAFADTDFIFLSNLRRFRELEEDKIEKCIVTSNIPSNQVYLRTDYKDLLNDNSTVKDNAGLLAVKFLMLYGADEIILAGFDGYSHDSMDNYADQSLVLVTKNELADAMNLGMSQVLKSYMKKIGISFLTKQKYVRIED